MKKLFTFIVACLMAATGMAQIMKPKATIVGSFADYEYFYVVPTSSMTSSSAVVGGSYGVYGGATKTIVPSDVINGYLMQNDYNTTYMVSPELADKTLVVTYGNTGRRQLGLFSYASGIIIQMKNAKTQDLVATFVAEGCGEDETENIYKAIYSALNTFSYNARPRLDMVILRTYSSNVVLELTNKTPKEISSVTVRLKYYLEDELVHEQIAEFWTSLDSGKSVEQFVHRDKPYRKYKYKVMVELIGYK